MSEVSRKNEDAGYPSPTKSRFVLNPLKAYEKEVDNNGSVRPEPVGLPARVIVRFIQLGMSTSSVETLGGCAMMLLAYLFQFRSVSVRQMATFHVEVTDNGTIRATFTHRKGKPKARSLALSCSKSDDWCGVVSEVTAR